MSDHEQVAAAIVDSSSDAFLTSAIASTRILVAEDNSAEARLAREWLLDKGFPEVDVATRLSEALVLLVGYPSSAAVALDLTLPDSNGLAMLRAARTLASHVPVVIVTGVTDQQVAIDALREGAQDDLIKGGRMPEVSPRALRWTADPLPVAADSNRLPPVLGQLAVPTFFVPSDVLATVGRAPGIVS